MSSNPFFLLKRPQGVLFDMEIKLINLTSENA